MCLMPQVIGGVGGIIRERSPLGHGLATGPSRAAPPSPTLTTCVEAGGGLLVGLAGAVGPEGHPDKFHGPQHARNAAHLLASSSAPI